MVEHAPVASAIPPTNKQALNRLILKFRLYRQTELRAVIAYASKFAIDKIMRIHVGSNPTQVVYLFEFLSVPS